MYHFSEKFIKNLIIVDRMLNDYYDRFIPSYKWQTDYICNRLNEAFEIIDQIIDHIKEDEDANWYYEFWSTPLTISSNDTTYNSYQKIMEHIKILEDSTDVHFLQGIFRIRDIVEENGHQNCKIV